MRPDGIDLSVRVRPNARREGFSGIVEGPDHAVHLAVHVRAVPEKGKANDALIALVAKVLDMPCSAVTLGAGASSRLKTVRIAGDPSRLAEIVEALAAQTVQK